MLHLVVLRLDKSRFSLLALLLLLAELIFSSLNDLFNFAVLLQFILPQLISRLDWPCDVSCLGIDLLDFFVVYKDLDYSKQLWYLLLLGDARLDLLLILTQALEFHFLMALIFELLCDLSEHHFFWYLLFLETVIFFFEWNRSRKSLKNLRKILLSVAEKFILVDTEFIDVEIPLNDLLSILLHR